MEKKPQLSTSMFTLWRSLVAIAWADGCCGKEETAYFARVFANLPRYYALTDLQRNALADDLVTPRSIDELLPQINDPEAQRLLALYAHDLVLLDGVVDPAEEDILKRLRAWEMPEQDRAALQKEIRVLISEKRAERATEKEELRRQVRGVNPLFAAVDKLLMRLGIDLIE
jgi:hypothetical protein